MSRIPESPRQRWKIGDILSFHMATAIEEFATFAAGNTLFTCGSFTGMASSLPVTGCQVGRYTEYATGGETMGFRHPIESVSVNSAVFNFARENISSYFKQYESRMGVVERVPVPTPQTHNHPITIGHDVWIGSDVVMSGGVTIGTGAVVAAKSVVTRDVEPYSFVAGIPAVHKRWRFERGIITELLDSRWWELELGDLFRYKLNFANPREFLKGLEKNRDKITIYSPRVFYPLEYALTSSGQVISQNHLYTAHLTCLAVDRANQQIRHVPENTMNPLIPVELVLREKGYVLSVGGSYISAISDDGFCVLDKDPMYDLVGDGVRGGISIRTREGVLSARPSGRVMSVAGQKEWETFVAGGFHSSRGV